MAVQFKKLRKLVLFLILSGVFAFWFFTAPASLAIQRIAAGSGNDSAADCIPRVPIPVDRLDSGYPSDRAEWEAETKS